MMHTKTEPFISTDSLTDAALADGSFSSSPSGSPLRRESEGSETIDQPEMLGEDTPLVSLQKDVVNLNNCLDGYIQHLSDGLAACEPTGSASRMLLSRTSLALFGLVAALTIALNATLLSMSAGSGQMLQANCALGVLHVLVSICVLHDLSKNRSQQSSECQVLELRTEDVVEQFKELTKTRQEWVTDLTRSQWIAETEKLKLQLVQQDLLNHQQQMETSQATAKALQGEIDRLRQESVASTQQCQDLTAILQTQQGELATLKTQMTAEQVTLTGLTDQVSACKREQSALQAEGEDQQHQLAAQRALLVAETEKVVGVKLEVESLTVQLQGLKDQYASLVADHELIELEVQERQIVCDQLLVDSEKATELLAQLQAEHDQCADVNSQLKADNATIEQQLLDGRSVLEEFEQRRLALHNECQALEQQNADDLQSRLRLSEELAAQKVLVDEQAEQYALCQSQVRECEEQIREKNQQIESLSADETAIGERVAWLLGQIGELERLCVAQLAQEHESMQNSPLDSEQLAAGLAEQTEIQATVQLNMQMTEQVSIVEQDLLSKRQEIATAQTKLEEVQRQLEMAKQKLAMDELAALAVAARVATMEIEIEQCKRQSELQEHKRQEIAAAQTQLVEVQQQLELANQQLTMHEQAAELAVARIAILEIEVEQELSQNQQQSELLEQKRQQVADAETNLTEVHQQLEIANQQLELSRQQLEMLQQAETAAAARAATLEVELEQESAQLKEQSVLLQQKRQDIVDAETHLADVQQQLEMANQQLTINEQAAQSAAARATSVEHELQQMQHQSDLLHEKATAMSEHVQAYSAELYAIKQEMVTLRAEVGDLESAKAHFKVLEQEIDALEQRWEQQRQLSVELNARIAADEVIATEKAQLVRQMEDELKSVAEQIATATEQLNEQRFACDRMVSQNQELSQSNSELEQQLEIAGQKTREVHDQMQVTQAEYELRLNLLQTTEQSIEELEIRRQATQHSYSQALQELELCQQQARDVQDAINTLQQNAEFVQAEIELSQEQLRQLDVEKLTSEHACDELRKNVVDLQLTQETLVNNMHELKLQEDAFKHQLQELTGEVGEAQTIAAQWNDYLLKLKSENQTLTEQRDRLSGLVSTLTGQVQDLNDQATQLQEVVQAAQAKADDLSQDCYAAQGNLDNLRAEVSRYDTAKGAALLELRELEASLQTLENQRQSLAASVEQCHREKAQYEGEVQVVQLQMHQLEMDLAQLCDKRSELNDQLQDSQSDVAATQVALDKLRDDEHQLKMSIGELLLDEEERRQTLAEMDGKLQLATMARRKLRRGLKRQREELEELAKQEFANQQAAQLDLDELHHQIHSESADLRSIQAALLAAKDEESQLRQAIQSQAFQFEKSEQELIERLATIDSLQLRAKTMKAANETLEKHLSGLTAERESLVTVVKTLELQRLESAQIERDLEENRVQLANCLADVAEAKGLKVTLDDQLAEVQQKLELLQEERSRVEAQHQQSLQANQQPTQERDVQVVDDEPISTESGSAEPSDILTALADQPNDQMVVVNVAILTVSEPMVSLEEDIWSSVQGLAQEVEQLSGSRQADRAANSRLIKADAPEKSVDRQHSAVDPWSAVLARN